MVVVVELFGIPRQRVGQSVVELGMDGDSARIADVLADLGRRYPKFAADCLEDGWIRTGYTVNIGGDRFVTDPQSKIAAGESLLVMSADAGG